MSGKREYGDYQTPDAFALKVCQYLKEKRKIKPTTILEPTCGTGSFIKNSLIFEAENIIGIDINKNYCLECEANIGDPRVQIFNADFFSFDFRSIIKDRKNILVIGNPPWVTNSTLSSLKSMNVPKKTNFKGLKGMDALTGASNFDICEYIILKTVLSLCKTKSTIAMLCKTSVARNVFVEMQRVKIPFSACDIFEFNASKVFGINAAACLLLIELNDTSASTNYCGVYSFDEPEMIVNRLVYQNGKLCRQGISDNYNFSGKSCFEWRQGVKHDCSKVMELSLDSGKLINGLKEEVDIEFDYVYPLIKSSMFKSAIISGSEKYVIVTQKRIRENTAHIEIDAPKTWQYLSSHKSFFDKRKSTIYKNSPDYSMFGVGDYSYSSYKVAVSGFYKKPLFALLSAKSGQPIMTDDTSYFICLPTYDDAYTAMLILNSECVQNYLCSIAFLDSKRPFTKKVLEQIDFHKVLKVIRMEDLRKTEEKLGLECKFNEDMFEKFKCLLEVGQIRLPLYAGVLTY